jgi:hypothetical protein
MTSTKDAIVAAMRDTLNDFYTKRPSSAMGNIPLAELAEAAEAAVTGVGLDKIPSVPEYDPDLTPKLRWNSPVVGYDKPAPGVGVAASYEQVRLIPYEGDYPLHDRTVLLDAASARAYALAILSAVDAAEEPTS